MTVYMKITQDKYELHAVAIKEEPRRDQLTEVI